MISNVPVFVTSYEQAMPMQISSGAYHNLVLSRAMPKIEHPNFDNQIVTSYGLTPESDKENKQVVAYQHRDDDCPNIESMKKLKAEIKRLR